MEPKSLYQYVKLGMNIEYLRGISSVSILPATSMVAFPNLTENMPAGRFAVMHVVEVFKSVQLQLEELQLPRSLAAAKELQPMLAEMEAYLATVPSPQGITLLDHFAEKIVGHTKDLVVAVKEETSAKMVTTAS